MVSTHKGIPPVAKDKSKNIALEARATSSSSLDTIVDPKYVNDDNNATLWIGNDSEVAWVQLDFGKKVQPSRVEIYPEFPIYAYSYRVETSQNGKDWEIIQDGENNTKIGSPLSLDKKLNMRYLRVNLSNKENDPRPGIWEIKVF